MPSLADDRAVIDSLLDVGLRILDRLQAMHDNVDAALRMLEDVALPSETVITDADFTA